MKNIFSFAVTAALLLSSMAQAGNADAELTALLRDTKKANTDALLVYKDGKLLYQYYAREYGPNTKHISFSMGKTISGILIGIAESEGLLSLNDKVKKYFPQIQSEARILDLLNMSSGLKYKEEFQGMLPIDLDVTNMMYLKGPKTGFANYMLALPPSDVGGPGDYFNYSSGDTNLLMAILKKAINNPEKYNSYPWDKFFKPLGIDATFEQDQTGVFVGGAYIFMSPMNFLKVGQLIMNQGMWNGQRIIPEKYFSLMNTVAEGVQKKVQKGNHEDKAYSVQITTNLPIPGRGKPSQFGDLPLDTLMLIGHQGQLVTASPSQNLVIVKLSMDKKDLSPYDVYAAVKKLILERGLNYQTVNSGQKSLTNVARGVDDAVETVVAIPQLLRAFGAQEFCSCVFVTGRSEDACKSDLKATFPLTPRLKIKDGNTVTSKFGTGLLGKVSKSVYRGKALGCVLMETE